MSELLAERARPDVLDDVFELPRTHPARAWSRAGAIAEMVAVVPPARLGRASVRLALVTAGSVLVALAVAVTLWTELGPGPLDVFIGAVRERTGLPLGLAIWLVVGSLIALAWSLGRRPGPATLVGPLVVGPVMQFGVGVLDTIDVPDALIVRMGIHVVAVLAIGLGAGMTIASGLGAGSGELLAIAAAARTGRRQPHVRLVLESTWLVVGVALGGPIGLGTFIVALAIGPAVEMGYRTVVGVARRLRVVRPGSAIVVA